MDPFLLCGLQGEKGEFPGAAWHLKVSVTLCTDGISPFLLGDYCLQAPGGGWAKTLPSAPRSPDLCQLREAGRWTSLVFPFVGPGNRISAKQRDVPSYPWVVLASPEAWPQTEGHRAWQGGQS